jgi:hypothetical protein
VGIAEDVDVLRTDHPTCKLGVGAGDGVVVAGFTFGNQ